ncbi:MAG TPA: branched-chain amino acid ABC transporter substrate-binding protein [Thermodesulfobacteriota bacterium]|nr:branched-chain amino acid ABC transporter substrate-binding protein [Thermodesulfobacteriota bacterium]
MGKKLCVTVLLVSMVLLATPSSMVFGAEKKVVKIGFIGPLTGPNAAIGLGARNSADLAIRQANEKGTYPYKLELVVMDDASDPTTGVAAATKLCSDPEVAAATTHFNSPVGLATIHVFHRYGVPQMFWGGIHPDITNKYNHPEVTRICPNTYVEHDTLAKFVVEKLGYKNWSIIYDVTSYGKSCLDAVKSALNKTGGKILSEDAIPVGAVDFRPILSKIKALKPGPQVVYYGGVVTEAALIKIQMNELGMKNLYVGVTGLDSETFNQTAGEAAEGTLIVGKAEINESSPFAKAYKAAGYKEFYEASGPYAYDSVNLILEAIKKVGPEDKKALAKAIRGMEYKGIIGVTKFDKFGQTVSGGLTLKVSQDKKWVVWGDSEYAKGKRKLPGK